MVNRDMNVYLTIIGGMTGGVFGVGAVVVVSTTSCHQFINNEQFT